MKRYLMISLMILIFAVLGGPYPAMAQYRPAYVSPAIVVGGDPCAMTANTSAMCITNHTASPILKIEAVAHAFDPGAWVNINGMIMPGATKIVTFPVWAKGTCVMHIYIVTANWQQHTVPDVDVCRTTRLTLAGRGW